MGDTEKANRIEQAEAGTFQERDGNSILTTVYMADSIVAAWDELVSAMDAVEGWRLPWLNYIEAFERVATAGGALWAMQEEGEPVGIFVYSFMTDSLAGRTCEFQPLVTDDLAKWIPRAIAKFEEIARDANVDALHFIYPPGDEIEQHMPAEYRPSICAAIKRMGTVH